MTVAVRSYRFSPPKLIAGVLCLDFINTVSYRGDTHDRGERLTSYSELIAWARPAGIVGAGVAASLLKRADRNPGLASAVVVQAIEFREALARLLLTTRGRAAGDLAIVNDRLAAAPARSRLLSRNGDYFWAGDAKGKNLAEPIYPVVWSAADLLASERLRLVRSCGDERCGWFFLDTSPSGRRRWCSMKECGNRAKARRFYHANGP